MHGEEDLSDTDSSSSSEGSFDGAEDNEGSICLDKRITAMLKFLSDGGTKVPTNYMIGSTRWKGLWSVALNAMSGTTSQRYRLSGDLEVLPSIGLGKKIQQQTKKKELKSLPSIMSSTYSDDIGLPYPGVKQSNAKIRDVVGILTREKQIYLMKVLDKMEANLEKKDISGIGIRKPARIKASDELQYAFKNKLKYGRTTDKDGDVTSALRRIAAAIRVPSLKNRVSNVMGRGNVELLGPTAFRERLASEYKVPLSSHEVNLLVEKFDVEKRGSVNLADVFGNAILISKKKSSQHRGGGSVHGSNGLDISSLVSSSTAEGGRSAKSSPLDAIWEKLGGVAADIVRGGTLQGSFLRSTSTRISAIEFKHIIMGLDCGISRREVKLLERKYAHVSTGSILMSKFIEDFKKVGNERLLDSENDLSQLQGFNSTESIIIASEGAPTQPGGDHIEFHHKVRRVKPTLQSHAAEPTATPSDSNDQPPINRWCSSSDPPPEEQVADEDKKSTALDTVSGNNQRDDDDSYHSDDSRGEV